MIGAIVALFLLGILFGGLGFNSRAGFGNWGMMGGNMMGGWGYSPFGWPGMLLMRLIPIGLVVLTFFGFTWLVNNAGGGNKNIPPVNACPSCNRVVESDWKNCAYCGINLN